MTAKRRAMAARDFNGIVECGCPRARAKGIGPDDPHPFMGADKTKPCLACGFEFYESAGHWRQP